VQDNRLRMSSVISDSIRAFKDDYLLLLSIITFEVAHPYHAPKRRSQNA